MGVCVYYITDFSSAIKEYRLISYNNLGNKLLFALKNKILLFSNCYSNVEWL